MLQHRINNSIKFLEVLNKHQDIIRTQRSPNSVSSWFGFSMILQGIARGKRNILEDILIKNGIEYRPIVAGNFTRQPVIKHLRLDPVGNYPNADEVHYNGIFVGNDSRGLRNELGFLDLALTEFRTAI